MSSDRGLAPWGLSVLRVVAGVVFFMHGRQKLFGFGFHGVTGMLRHLGFPLPPVMAVILILLEVVGGLALVAGVFTRWVAALFTIEMLIAVLKVHLKNGFFLPTGFEFALTMAAISVTLALAGPGALALDRLRGRQ